MKSVFCSAVLTVALVAPGLSAPATAKKDYYRHRAAAAVGPRDADVPQVVNAASFEPGVSPGGLATIFGRDLTSVTGVVIAQSLPLPTVLANVTVLVNNQSAPIYSIAFANGEDQISFQMPYSGATGPGAVQIEVFDGNVQTANITADSFTEDPGIFVYDGYALAVHADGALVGPDDPSQPGEVLVLYTTGLGPLSMDLQDGFGAPANPLAYTVDPFQVMVNGENCEILFSGLAPGFVGLYQINFRVPRDAQFGDQEIKIQSPYASSKVAILPIHPASSRQSRR